MGKIKKTDLGKTWAKNQLKRKPYNENIREIDKSFLIICEGENTEPSYFNSFQLGSAQIKSYGIGSSKTALVEYILQNEVEGSDNVDSEIWAVFDFDIKPDQIQQQREDYNLAIELAERNNIRVAYSNDAFELWFLLHYQALDTQWTRHQYYQKLSEFWSCNYEKQGKHVEFCHKIYQKLLDDPRSDQNEAISRASRMLGDQQELPFADRNPCTTVFELVKELNEYLK